MVRRIEGFAVCYVYEHWRPDTDTCFYVGKGSGYRARAMAYGRGRYHKNVQAKLARLGLSVEVRIIADGLTDTDALAFEVERIAFWTAAGVKLVNRTLGGEGTRGYRASPETRAKLGAKSKAAWQNPEHRARIIASRTGLKRAPEVGRKIGDALRGKPKSAIHRQRASEWQRGRVLPEGHRESLRKTTTALWQDPAYRAKTLSNRPPQKTKPVVCEDDGRVFPSMTAAAEFYGLKGSGGISSVCNRRKSAKTAGGRSFSFVSVEP